MIAYNPDLENFVDGIDFDASQPCIWVVYPPGCAGDLLASIINFHYVETGAKFRGITNSGQIIFRPSDQKYSNQLANLKQLEFTDSFFFNIADILASVNLNWSKMDQFIFSNHCYLDSDIQSILGKFENCKVVRLLPKTQNEEKITRWLAQFKNRKVILTLPVLDNDAEIEWADHQDRRVLTVYFSDLIDAEKFESTYQMILAHLDIKSALVRYDFIQDWINQQHPDIQECIIRLTSN